MSPLSAAAARRRISELLDAAERGADAIIERRGVQFRVVAIKKPAPKKRRKPIFKFSHPAVEAGDWTWQYEPGKGLTFVPFPSKRRFNGSARRWI